ncbi:PREDICTED: uncharacterized protein DDB_G0287625 [Dufourea novaeangliae]|nr:PREDICTED: uncharacterized protein DDB_G0287625 [Dufourea novaeangliae]
MTTLKGVFPDLKPARRKNFIHENVKNLRHLEKSLHANKGVGDAQNVQLHERKKISNPYQNVLPKLNSNLGPKKYVGIDVNLNARDKLSKNCVENQQKLCGKSSMPVMNKNNSRTKKTLHSANSNNSSMKQKRKNSKNLHKSDDRLHENVSSDSALLRESPENASNEINTKTQIKYKNQSIQTLDTNQMDNLYSEGIIRYPSKNCLNTNESRSKNDTIQQNDNVLRDTTSSSNQDQSEENSEFLTLKGELDDTKLNTESTPMINKTAARLNNNNNSNNYNKITPSTNYRKGVVPKYIKERKEAQKKEQKAKEEALDPNCPNGHVPLPENERKETLYILKKNYQDYVNELNMMPIKSDTLRAQQRKAEIEKQLNKLEEGIKVFSKPKVYVKMNA